MPEWFVIESARRVHPLHSVNFYRYWGRDLGIDGAIIYKARESHYLFRRDQFDAKAKSVFDKILKNPGWLVKSHQRIRAKANAYRKASEELSKIDFSNKSKKELVRLFNKYFKAYTESHCTGQIDNLIEMEHEYLSNHVKRILAKTIEKKGLALDVGEAFNLISLPKEQSEMQEQEKSFLSLAAKLLKKPAIKKLFLEGDAQTIEAGLKNKAKEFDRALERHFQKFKWLPFMYEGPAWEKSYFINLLSSIVKQGTPLKELREKQEAEKTLARKRDRLWNSLALKGRDKIFAEFVPTSIYLKAFRKEQMYYGCFVSQRLFQAIGRTLNLSLDQVRYFLPEEVKPALTEGKYNPEVLNQRFMFGIYRIINGKEDFLIGDHARRFHNQIYKEEEYSSVTELQGSCAFPGKVEGKVRVINHPNEMFAMNEGDVMVSHSTNPNLVPAMRKAGAIVTDVGGITCHAAIVSRELKKPCVIGTKIATKILKDNDLVEVDANHGQIKKVKR